MLSVAQHSLVASTIALIYYVLRYILAKISYAKKVKANRCGEIQKYPHWDPFLGLDFIRQMKKAFNGHRWLRWQQELFAAQRTKTFQVNFVGTRYIWTSESENMKAISVAPKWQIFGVQPLRRGNGAADPIAGPGVNSADGHAWEFSRNLTKPYFTRDGYSNLGRLQVHTDRLLGLIPRDRSSFDVLPLLQRWFLDTSTEFLFGESVNSLEYPEHAEIVEAMVELARGLRARLQMSKFVFLHRDKHWFEAVQFARHYLGSRIEKTLDELQNSEKMTDSGNGHKTEERTDLLWDIAQHVRDKEILLDQIMAVFIPSNDTTSVLISNALFALARQPRIWDELRKEVLLLGDQPLTFERLRGLRYLNYIINETHRVYPNAIQMVRLALEDTTLPIGGGPSGTQPIFVQKGDVVAVNRYMMHRDPDIWGPDAEEFRPERWQDARPMWRYVPFGGGPRICPAHVLVNTEAAYVLSRIAQTFSIIEPRDDRKWTPVMRIGPSNLHGVKIALTPI